MPGTLAPSRRGLALLGRALVVVAVLAVALWTSTARAAGATPVTQGIFEGCSLSTQIDTCLQRLSVIHSGGLGAVVVSVGDPVDDVRYAQAAQALGMRVVWAISDPYWWGGQSYLAGDYGGFQAACGCTDRTSLLGFLVRSLGAI